MYKIITLFLVVVLFSSCSLLKLTQNEPQIFIDQGQLDSLVEVSVSELIEGDWLSDFLMQNNERPILVASKFVNETTAVVDTIKLYETINLALIRSGQVRVVKLDSLKRQKQPVELAKGKSIDFVVKTEVVKIIQETTSSPLFKLTLWHDKSVEPILSIEKEIK